VVASIDYRLTGEAKYLANIKDVKAAIRWMRSNANQYGIDQNRGSVGGVSADGRLAALAATSCGAVNPKSPPLVIVVGDKDQVVGQQQSIDFDKLLRGSGVKSELHLIRGVGHSFIGANHEETSKASNFALDKSLEFLDATFGAKQPAKKTVPHYSSNEGLAGQISGLFARTAAC
jgi:acetyl esterase/lipase